MKNIKYITAALSMVLLISACAKIDPDYAVKSDAKNMTTLMATFADGTGSFKPAEAEPYPEDLTIEVPWYFPDGSYTETTLDKLFLTATLPNSAYMSPSFGVTDLTSPKTFTLTAQNGDNQQYTISAVRKKSNKANIEEFKLNEANINCIVVNNKVIIPYTTEDISNQTVTFVLSYYATISPDPAVAHDYTSPVTYTVTAQDGTTKTYSVEIGMPVKVPQGFASVKKLWSLAAGDLGFEDYANISIAVSGDYLVLPFSNEWVGGSTVRYYNRKTGAYVGDMDVTGASGIYSVASDSKGNIVGINNIYAYSYVCLFKWSSVTAAPVLLAQSTDWSCVESNFYGRKLSVYGDLDGDAVIMATTDGKLAWNNVAPNRILKWTVHNGVIVSQTPESFVYPTEWSNVAKAVPTGSQPDDNYYLASDYPIFIDYINGADNSKLYSFASPYLPVTRDGAPALTYFEFNNAKYVSITDVSAWSGAMHIFDVTDPSDITIDPGSTPWEAFHVFDGSDDYILSPSPNWNVTAEIAVTPVSDDGFTMTLYFLNTNGGINAYELSCIDEGAFGK